jgi:chemotaxis protein methyltransferase CheR
VTMDLPAPQYDRLRHFLRRACGLALGDDKQYLVRQRLEPVALACGCADFRALADSLELPAAAWLREQVVEAMTTHETAFFRDVHPFEALKALVLPETVSARASSRPVMVLSAAAATGQEPYSLGICILEYLEEARPRGLAEGDFLILAADISARALAAAEAGVYADREVQRGLTPARVRQHFRREGAGWAVNDRLRRMVQFRRLNLAEPFGGLGLFDVIFCRNVLIYFDDPTRQRVCDGLAGLLLPGGHLCLGAAESLYGLAHGFETVRQGETVLYRKPR